MRARTMIFLSLAIVAAGSTFMLAQNWIQSQRANLAKLAEEQRNKKPEPQPAVMVLVAGQDLLAGEFVKPQHLKWQAWPETGVAESYFRKDGKEKIEDFTGAVVRSRITVGEPITDGRLVRPGDRGFLAAVLKPGKRAISVPVNATTGISGFVFPGDYVDLLLTHAIREENSRASRRATETILQNIRVLAVDQRTEEAGAKATVAKTATLEVDPKEAEVIGVASDMGRLSLSLRSLGQRLVNGKPVPDAHTHTWDTEASQLIPRPRRARDQLQEVRVVRGGETTVFAFERNRVQSITGLQPKSAPGPEGAPEAVPGDAPEAAVGATTGAVSDGLADTGHILGKVY